MLIATLLCAWSELRGMATTSLWNDELFSIARYSAKGPLFTTTNYTEPNNHILYNLLTSLTLGNHPFDPGQARSWSFVFVTLSFFGIIMSQALAGQRFEGSVQAFLLLANLSYLDLILQARGYGILSFSAIMCTVLTWEYFRRPALLSLVGVPVFVWLGTWAVPTFVLFGAALFLVLATYTRDWRWVLSGAFASLAICLVYWPVYAGVLRSSKNYAAHWGKEFANWSAIGDVFCTYLFFGMSGWLTFLVVAAVTAAFLLGRIESAAEKASLCLGLAILLTFTACLKMQTPAKRTIAFVVVPYGFIVTTFLSKFLRSSGSRWLRLSIMFGIAITALAFALHVRKTFHFVPIEGWLETARTIEDRFPKGVEVVALFRPQWLKSYLSADYPVTEKYDASRFITGQQIVVDSSFRPKERFPATELPPGYAVSLVPQRRGGNQKIYFWTNSQAPTLPP